MALPLQQTPSSTQPRNLLTEIETQGTPLRIDGQTETYYVLSASQLNALINRSQDDSANFEDATNFTPEDFGLTEADLDQHEKTQQVQQQHIASHALKPLSEDLGSRITQQAQSTVPQQNKAERDELLAKLEAAMLTNLQASILASSDR